MERQTDMRGPTIEFVSGLAVLLALVALSFMVDSQRAQFWLLGYLLLASLSLMAHAFWTWATARARRRSRWIVVFLAAAAYTIAIGSFVGTHRGHTNYIFRDRFFN